MAPCGSDVTGAVPTGGANARDVSHHRTSGGPATISTKIPARAAFSRPRLRPGRGPELTEADWAGAAAERAGEDGESEARGTGATRGSWWHLGHCSVPSGRLAQQDRQNIARGEVPARARAPGGTAAGRTQPAASSRRAP